MPKRISAIILAAGRSKRMGSPKMLLPWGDTSVIGQVIKNINNAGIDDIVIVTGAAKELVEREANAQQGLTQVRCVHNRDYENEDMLSSLRCGIGGMETETAAVLICLGDQPQVSSSAISRIISCYQETGASLVVPSFNMRRGHPWLVGSELWDDLIFSDKLMTMRDILNQHTDKIRYVETDLSVLKDLDTPEDYQREKP